MDGLCPSVRHHGEPQINMCLRADAPETPGRVLCEEAVSKPFNQAPFSGPAVKGLPSPEFPS